MKRTDLFSGSWLVESKRWRSAKPDDSWLEQQLSRKDLQELLRRSRLHADEFFTATLSGSELVEYLKGSVHAERLFTEFSRSELQEALRACSLKHYTQLHRLSKPSRLATAVRLYRESRGRMQELLSWSGRRVTRPPGSLLGFLADFFCSPKTMENLVEPILSDMQLEYFGALAAGRNLKAAWIRVRGGWSFFKALGLYNIEKHSPRCGAKSVRASNLLSRRRSQVQALPGS